MTKRSLNAERFELLDIRLQWLAEQKILKQDGRALRLDKQKMKRQCDKEKLQYFLHDKTHDFKSFYICPNCLKFVTTSSLIGNRKCDNCSYEYHFTKRDMAEDLYVLIRRHIEDTKGGMKSKRDGADLLMRYLPLFTENEKRRKDEAHRNRNKRRTAKGNSTDEKSNGAKR